MMMNDDIHFVYMIIHSDQSPAVIHRVIWKGRQSSSHPTTDEDDDVTSH